MKPNELTREIIGGAIEVHRELGPGKPEAAYEDALSHELGLRSLAHRRQEPLPVRYKGTHLECGYRLDLLVTDTVVVEVKSIEALHPIHRAQVLTYLKLGGWHLALLLNFNVAVLKEGIERLVLGFREDAGETAETRRTQSAAAATGPIMPCPTINVDSGDREAEILAREVIAAALEVHRELGPGLLASAYEACLCHELRLRGVPIERKRRLPLSYKGTPLAESDEIGLLVGERVVVMPRAVNALEPVHEAQLLSQLRLGGWGFGLLLNFNTMNLGDGLRRVVLTRSGETAKSCGI